MQELLRVAAQHSMKPGYVKYSHASYLHPMLQPVEYQTFPKEVEVLGQHIGHLGNGGSAYQLGDSLYGLQWHVFVAAEPSFVPTVAWPSDCELGTLRGSSEGSGLESPSVRSPGTPTGDFLLLHHILALSCFRGAALLLPFRYEVHGCLHLSWLFVGRVPTR